MHLNRLEASGFRNLDGEAEFGTGLNIFYGDNAQGKTNWLEAIYVLGMTRSFRTSQIHDCLNFESSRSLLRGEVKRGPIDRSLQLQITDSSKEMFVNAKRETLARYTGNLDVLAFSLEELSVIRGDPAERRRFLDRAVASVTRGYPGTLSQYNKVVKQKNRLLGEAAEGGDVEGLRDQIAAWNEQLADFGETIHKARTGYIERLDRVLSESDHGRRIFDCERVNVRYRSQLEGKGDLDNFGELFRQRLALRMPAEIAAGHCLIGPHRDDLEVTTDGRETARFGSAGQQRSALLLLDLAQVEIYTSIYDESPVLVIDDIDAELDRGRIEALLSVLEGRTQTFVSTSRRAIANRYRDRASIYCVERGRAACETAQDKAIERIASNQSKVG